MILIENIKVRKSISHRKNLVVRDCKHCGEKFWCDPGMIRKGGGVFCEMTCYMAARKKGTRMEAEYRLVKKMRSDPVGKLKLAAYHQVRKALRDGVLERTNCQVCKSKTKKVEAHHDDYSKPLVVKWVCRQCHNDIHKDDRKNWRTKNNKQGGKY